MKQNIMSKSATRRILQYENHRGRQLLMVVLGLFAIIAFLWGWCEPASAAGYGSALGLAAMTGIASISDVSDKETHGNEIGYFVALIPVAMINDPMNFPQPEAGSRAIAAFQLKTGDTDAGQYIGKGRRHDKRHEYVHNDHGWRPRRPAHLRGGVRRLQVRHHVQAHQGFRMVCDRRA